MAYDVFISYSRKDSKIAEEICSALSAAGLTYFIDREGIAAGQNFPQVLAEAVDASTVFLFLASRNSFQSRFTRGEVTYAFNHKHSGAIIPYIIDGSQTMPPDLELMLGNFNWRRRELCPVTPGLVEDIRQAVAHPEAGTVGGRHVLSDRKKKMLGWGLASVLTLLVLAVLLFALSNGRKRADNRAAMEASRLQEQLILQSDSLVACFEEMKASPRTLETTGEQIADLQQALLLLDSAEVVAARFDDSSYKGLFDHGLADRSASITSRLDSVHAAWAAYARESYALYAISKRPSERDNILSCIAYALSIKTDPELETIKKELNR